MAAPRAPRRNPMARVGDEQWDAPADKKRRCAAPPRRLCPRVMRRQFCSSELLCCSGLRRRALGAPNCARRARCRLRCR
jgi:hypothetical protein